MLFPCFPIQYYKMKLLSLFCYFLPAFHKARHLSHSLFVIKKGTISDRRCITFATLTIELKQSYRVLHVCCFFFLFSVFIQFCSYHYSSSPKLFLLCRIWKSHCTVKYMYVPPMHFETYRALNVCIRHKLVLCLILKFIYTIGLELITRLHISVTQTRSSFVFFFKQCDTTL